MRKVVLAEQASIKLENLLNYLKTEWSESVKQDFIRKLDEKLDFISLFPEATEKSNLKEGLHRCVITKQTTLYYLFNDIEIQIVTIFDTRMNIERLKREIQ
jgi:plasmid stabilization system protein ParE